MHVLNDSVARVRRGNDGTQASRSRSIRWLQLVNKRTQILITVIRDRTHTEISARVEISYVRPADGTAV